MMLSFTPGFLHCLVHTSVRSSPVNLRYIFVTHTCTNTTLSLSLSLSLSVQIYIYIYVCMCVRLVRLYRTVCWSFMHDQKCVFYETDMAFCCMREGCHWKMWLHYTYMHIQVIQTCLCLLLQYTQPARKGFLNFILFYLGTSTKLRALGLFKWKLGCSASQACVVSKECM